MRGKKEKNDKLKKIVLKIEIEKWKIRVSKLRRCGKMKFINEIFVSEVVDEIKKKIEWKEFEVGVGCEWKRK